LKPPTFDNGHLRPLVRYLWHGPVDEAQQYLAAIPAGDLHAARIW